MLLQKHSMLGQMVRSQDTMGTKKQKKKESDIKLNK